MRILLESRHADGHETRIRALLFQKTFGHHLPSTNDEPRLLIPVAPDAPRLMSTARKVASKAVDYGAQRFECPLVAVNGSRTGPRDQRSRASSLLAVRRWPLAEDELPA